MHTDFKLIFRRVLLWVEAIVAGSTLQLTLGIYIMKALTFAWDYPPETTGGLGIACHGLVSELTAIDVEVIFVLPRRQKIQSSGARFIFADIIPPELETFALPGPYQHSSALLHFLNSDGTLAVYSRQLIEATHDFAAHATIIAKNEDFDIIHAHDWTSYLAGIAAKRVSGKPLVLHVHATGFDQAGGGTVDPSIYAIEQVAFKEADCIITVSELTKTTIVSKHGVDAQKVAVVHNGTEVGEPVRHVPTLQGWRKQGKKIILYHGRITIQKGVDYFVLAARKVIDHNPNVVFVISGKGDMEAQIMQQVGALGLSQHVLFAGALWYEDRDRMYQSVDLVVMPSVSEPFGLVPLEAMRHGTPALISKQSGVAEVTTHVLKVDFWDVDEMANKILATLRYPVLQQQLRTEGKLELLRHTWHVAALKVRAVYDRVLQLVQRLAS